MSVETQDHELTSELVKLARRTLHGDSPLSDEGGFARLQHRLARPQRPFWTAGRLGLVAGLAAAGALALSLSLREHARLITYQVAGGGLDQTGRVIGQSGTKIRFSDGSEASLTPGAVAQVANVTEHGADVVLSRGSMRVHIAKKPHASWKVAAGPYDVRVTGTAFDVSWSAQNQAFDLRMETGAVIVTGPMAAAGIPLRAGQHMFGGVAEGRLTVEGAEEAMTKPRPTSRVPTLETTSEPLPPVASAVRPAANAVVRPASEPHTWNREVAQGRFDAVLEQAEQRGMDRLLSGGSLEELAALADAARYAGRSAIAKRVLQAERERFGGSTPARDAAFFLGRIAEDGGGGALEWYERYLEESPRGAYASQALGRKMMLLYKQRGRGAAEPIALEYLNRYPNGPYAAAARKIDQEYSPASKP